MVLCALVALINAAPVLDPERALEGRDLDCSGKRGLERRQCPGAGSGPCKFIAVTLVNP